MNTRVTSLARAVVDVCRMTPPDQYGEVIEVALLLLSQRRCNRSMLRRFQRCVEMLWMEQEGVFSLTIESASGKEGGILKGIVMALEECLGRKAELTEQQSLSLIGGVKIAFGDERIDASLRGRLSVLQKVLCAPVPFPS